MLRSAPNFTSSKVSGVLISKMDATQHDRGWDLAAENGIISVELVDQAPKEQPAPEKPKKGAPRTKAPKMPKRRRSSTPKDLTPMRGDQSRDRHASAHGWPLGSPLLYL